MIYRKKLIRKRKKSVIENDQLQTEHSVRPRPSKISQKHSKRSSFPSEILFTENSALKSRVPSHRAREESVVELQSTLQELQQELEIRKQQLFKLKEQEKSDQEFKQLALKISERNSLILAIFDKTGNGPLMICERISQCPQGIDFLIENSLVDDKVSIHRLSRLIMEEGVSVSEDHVQEFRSFFPDMIPKDLMQMLYNHYLKYESRELSPAIHTLLRHIAMRMQIFRIPKDRFASCLFGKDTIRNIQKEHLKVLLGEPPLNFHRSEDLELLCRFLLDKKDTVSYISSRLERHLPDWQVFSNEQEEQLEEELKNLISNNKAILKKSWEQFDLGKTGVISLDSFFSVFKELNLIVSSKILSYMRMIFYSYLYDLDKAPYLHFIESYSQRADDSEDEENTRLVRKYLELIARNLMKNSLSIRSAFSDRKGMIYLDEFMKGLNYIGMGAIDPDTVKLIVQALQYEGPSEKLCISLEELEEIFEFYGVAKDIEKTIESAQSTGSVILKNDFEDNF